MHGLRVVTSLILAVLFATIVLAGSTAAQGEQGTGEGEILYWTCGMHPSVRAEEAGKCPICNMDLVPVLKRYEEPSEEDVSKEIELRISRDAARLARLKTVEVTRKKVSKIIRATGEVTYDETRMAVITARVGGRIEKLYADYTGKEFEAGDRLASIYSPGLLSAQKEYLLARDSKLESAAKEKLLLWGITEKQIRKLENSGEPQINLTIHAPIGGTVIHKNVLEGIYVKEGDPLFHMADLSRVWVLADVFEKDLGALSPGQEAVITSEALPGEAFEGQVTFIDPFLDRKTRSTKVRIELDNTERKFIPGMFARVEIKGKIPGMHGAMKGHAHGGITEGESRSERSSRHTSEDKTDLQHAGHRPVPEGEGVLVVPRSAIINTGKRTIAFVEIEEGRYVIRHVTLGIEVEGYYVVLGGLREGEQVVERGSFLLDSQTQLTGEAEEIYGGAIGKESKKDETRHKH